MTEELPFEIIVLFGSVFLGTFLILWYFHFRFWPFESMKAYRKWQQGNDEK